MHAVVSLRDSTTDHVGCIFVGTARFLLLGTTQKRCDRVKINCEHKYYIPYTGSPNLCANAKVAKGGVWAGFYSIRLHFNLNWTYQI